MSYSDEKIQKVWEKGTIVTYFDKDKYRKDHCNAWIMRTEYGKRNSLYGWEVHHNKSKEGDELEKLSPLQWKNNVTTGEGTLKCPVTAEGSINVEKK